MWLVQTGGPLLARSGAGHNPRTHPAQHGLRSRDMNKKMRTLPTDFFLSRLVQKTLASGGAETTAIYESPVGDPGLFGPETVAWRIHADFPGMMAGGLGALLLQTLHPLALAGVWDHSNFREDLLGRLRRTTAFVALTTYAPRERALQEIDRVRRIHRRVTGVLPDGRRYAADDPELLTWVHLTEVWSFVRGYQVYRGIELSRATLDRYFDETRRVAEALGATQVPRSLAEVEAYFESVRPRLVYTERSAEVIRVLKTIRLPGLSATLMRGLFLGSGAALLPDWAHGLMGRGRRQRMADGLARLQLRSVSPLIRSALRDGISARAARRVGLPDGALQLTPD